MDSEFSPRAFWRLIGESREDSRRLLAAMLQCVKRVIRDNARFGMIIDADHAAIALGFIENPSGVWRARNTQNGQFNILGRERGAVEISVVKHWREENRNLRVRISGILTEGNSD